MDEFSNLQLPFGPSSVLLNCHIVSVLIEMFQKKEKKKKKTKGRNLHVLAQTATRGHCSFNLLRVPLSVFACCLLIIEVFSAPRGSSAATGARKSCVFLAQHPPHQLGQLVPVRMAADDANIMAEQLKQPTRRRW